MASSVFWNFSSEAGLARLAAAAFVVLAFAVLAFAVSAYILYWLKQLKDNQLWTSIGLSLVLGGAIGNLIDRVLQAKVTDFIDFYIDWDVFFLSNGHFATFNIADIAIAVGAGLLVIISLFTKDEA